MRNFKALGFALGVVLAISATAASMASGDDLTAEKYPTTLTGDQDAQTDVLTTTLGNIGCKKINYQGTVVAPTTEVSVTPTFSECTAFGFTMIVDVNGCTYKFKLGAAGSTRSTIDIVCPAGQEITVTANAPATLKCTMHIPPQTGLAQVTWTNIGSGTTREVTGDIEITNFKYTHTAGTGLGACTSGSGTTGKYTGKIRLTGEEDIGPNHIGIFFS